MRFPVIALGVLVFGSVLSGCSNLVISKVAFGEHPSSLSMLRVTVENEESEAVDFQVAYCLVGTDRKLSPTFTIPANSTKDFEFPFTAIGLKNSFGIDGPFWICVETTKKTKPHIVKFAYPTSYFSFAAPIDTDSHDLMSCPDPFDGP